VAEKTTIACVDNFAIDELSSTADGVERGSRREWMSVEAVVVLLCSNEAWILPHHARSAAAAWLVDPSDRI
jgi:hypothetical protein